MFNSHVYRKLWLAVAVVGLFTGCSDQPASEATKPAATAKKAETAKPAAVASKVTEPPQLVTVPKGTVISATVGQTLASNKNHPGDTFDAKLSTPVAVDGKVVLPKGAHVTGRVVTVKKHELKLALASVVVQGKSYDLATNSIRPSEKSQAKISAKDTAAAKDKPKDDKDKNNLTVPVKTQLTFKLSKSVTVPAKS